LLKGKIISRVTGCEIIADVIPGLGGLVKTAAAVALAVLPA